MPRPEKKRMVDLPPIFNSFKPTGFKKTNLKKVSLSIDEYEAIRLADYECLDQKKASEIMGISRPTFTRLIEKARKKVSTFIIEGTELNLEGGNIDFRENIFRCKDCSKTFKVALDNNIESCKNCGSKNLVDIARGYGHRKHCKKQIKESSKSCNKNRCGGNNLAKGGNCKW